MLLLKTVNGIYNVVVPDKRTLDHLICMCAYTQPCIEPRERGRSKGHTHNGYSDRCPVPTVAAPSYPSGNDDPNANSHYK